MLLALIIARPSDMNLVIGLETPALRAAPTEMGCRAYQGYYFSKPVPVSDFEKLFA